MPPKEKPAKQIEFTQRPGIYFGADDVEELKSLLHRIPGIAERINKDIDGYGKLVMALARQCVNGPEPVKVVDKAREEELEGKLATTEAERDVYKAKYEELETETRELLKLLKERKIIS